MKMKVLHFCRFLFFLVWCSLALSQYLAAQSFSKHHAERFIDHLSTQSDSLINDVDANDYRLSQRLGIRYLGVKHKFLISYELDSTAIPYILKNAYHYKIDSLEAHYSMLTVSLAEKEYQRQYYFHDSLLISPCSYYARHWTRFETPFFVFVVSDTSACNRYSMNALDCFVQKMLDTLSFDERTKLLLKREKVYYFLCKNEQEIEQLTGFKTRGIYNLAYDYIVTTYNCHYHELLHLLMNVKLKTLPLYTLPFLQEGFAVAFGGRGGYEPSVVLNMGMFLQQSGLANINDLLTKQLFLQNDASISYPLCGLYTKYLFETSGIDAFVRLYRSSSGTADQIDTMRLNITQLSSSKSWEAFLKQRQRTKIFDFTALTEKKNLPLSYNNSRYYFCLKDTLLLNSKQTIQSRTSKKFGELFPTRNYRGEKYAIIANDAEISLYNLLTGNLIASYVKSFSLSPVQYIDPRGYIQFSLPSTMFDEQPQELVYH
jgi:hypothetical protein